nr:DUF2232 domain-containing protein [candidate division Zixibacteria bacterium]
MMPTGWKQIEPFIKYGGLLITLLFLAVSEIVLVGYVAQIGVLFTMILFAFRRYYVFLVIGALGSLAVGYQVLGFSSFMMIAWAVVVIPGVLLGGLIASGRSTARAFAYAIGGAAILAVAMYFMQRSMIDMAINELRELTVMFVGDLGLSQVAETNLTDNVVKIVQLVGRLMPSLMALSAIAQLFLGWLLLVVVMHGLGEFFPTMGNFIYWKMPYFYMYGIGLFLVFRLVGPETARMVSDNGLVFLGFFYAVFGFSVIDYYLKRIRLSLFLRILFYIGFAFLQLPGLLLAALIGLLDSHFDFRRVRARIIG